MWTLATQEKAVRRFGNDTLMASPPGEVWPELWSRLDRTDKKRVVEFAKALLAAAGHHK